MRGARQPLHDDDVQEALERPDVGRTPVFFVREGAHVTVFRNDAQHLKGERLWWCPDERVFYAPTHGETFNLQGIALTSPAHRDLDRFATTVRHGLVTIDRNQLVRGGIRVLRMGSGPVACANASGP